MAAAETEEAEVTEALVAASNGPGAPDARLLLDLSWKGLVRMANLAPYRNVRSLYLQYNQIARIEGLEGLGKLDFLALHCNAIRRIEGLASLPLRFLDLSENLLEAADLAALPESLVILKLAQNPCGRGAYVEAAKERFAYLEKLDGEELARGAPSELAQPAALPGPSEQERSVEAAKELGEEERARGAVPSELAQRLAALPGPSEEAQQERFLAGYLQRDDRVLDLCRGIARRVTDFAAEPQASLSAKGAELCERSRLRRAAAASDPAPRAPIGQPQEG